MNLTIRKNLAIIDDRIISYSTEVGRLQNGHITVKGKYSRTTTKQINHLADILCIPVEYLSKSQQCYYEYSYGANIRQSEALSEACSKVILDVAKSHGTDLVTAAVLSLSKLKDKTKQRCMDQLKDLHDIDDNSIEDILFLHEVGLI